MHVCFDFFTKCALKERSDRTFTGSGGIGQATAKALARVGCSIAIHYNAASSKAKAETLISQLGLLAPQGVKPKFAAFQADLSKYEEARRLHAEVVKVLGNPDVLFSNHGIAGPKIGPTGDIKDVSFETFEEVWRTNTGTSYAVRALDAALPFDFDHLI